ncbi:hypothetical protein AMS58_10815 [Pseudoalteromonas porphyrae]|uniref:RDD domain-containing protein n=2 Tax=Pseudoalteromonas TaxID=53246 RepID=A0A0N1EUJ0_9GAMM|nr:MULTISPECIES: RDD family protein [Pseudoalteromonas]KPH63405.1 hypothetical protein ADS77_08920 [Pseudoalteromonas porphyrae]KPH94730.1 hypothetical protein AMS58_10815 [Pseudoalteromonas porphyrae]NMR26009.1 RDD family protein [Pseudoalteromonas sp. NEC-BIFX-2020_015]NNG45436.1 RDD family protein [Pseudoalteromonas sp. NEC-BIFX-2020_002]
MKAKEIVELELSSTETREIVTPFAFKIDQALLGLPLASPTRRAVAIIIDVALIFLAAKLSAALIAFVAAMAFYKGTAGKYLPNMSSFWRRVLKILAASALFTCSLVLLSEGIDYVEGDRVVNKVNKDQDIVLKSGEKQQVLNYLEQTENEKNCDFLCQQSALEQLIADVPKLQEIAEQEYTVITRVVLWAMVERPAKELDKEIKTPPVLTSQKTQSSTSILQWGKGIIEDLGLGFGWAAVYFTLFSLLWRGQTPGKKLCNIRVVALNGDYLSLWDSFGRYGGYGAGFATGLLGFLQIFWDPNRQAIQDKISATVVIRGDLNQQVNVETITKIVSD